MTNFNLGDTIRSTGATAKGAGTAYTAYGAQRYTPPSQPQQVFVQLGEARKSANIIRDRYQVPILQVDEAVLDDIVIGTLIRNKVVSQSIPAGTVVPVGTAVELVLAPTKDLPGRIIPDGHFDLAEATLESTYDRFIRDNSQVRRILERTPDAERLTSEDRAVLVEVADLEFTGDPGRTVEDFVRSLHVSKTMVE